MSTLALEAAKTVNHPLSYVEIAWQEGVAVTDGRGAVGWTDETAYVISHSGTLRIQPAGEALTQAGDIGTASVTLDNTTGRFNWQDPAAPLYAFVSGPLLMAGKPLRIWQGFEWLEEGVATQDYACIFTGVISGFKPETFGGRLTLECRDWGYRFLQKKASSVLYSDQLASKWLEKMCIDGGITAYRLETALYRIPYVWLDDESYIDEIWQVAEAVGGLVYFDQDGYLVFENPTAIVSHAQTVDWQFTENDYLTPDPDLNLDAVCSEVIVEVIGRDPGEVAVLYQLDTTKRLGAGSTLTFTARFNQPGTGIALAADYDWGHDNTDHLLIIDANGTDRTAQCAITLSSVCAQQATVTLVNTTTLSLRLVILDIAGRPLIGRPAEQVKEQAPTSLPFVRTRSVRSNPYVQTLGMAQALIKMLAYRLGQVRPLYKLTGVPGVPQLRLNNVISFRNTRAQGANNLQKGILTGLSWEWGLTTAFRQSLELMDLDALLPGDYTDFFIIGVTALGLHGRCYY